MSIQNRMDVFLPCVYSDILKVLKITIYIPTICICKGWKAKCRGILLFPREYESFLCCFFTEHSKVQKQHKKDENSRGKIRFPDISLFIKAYACIRCIDSFISQESLQKIREKISENVAKRVKKLYFLSLVTKSITFNP